MLMRSQKLRITAVQELQDFAEQLQHAGAGIKALNLAASPHMLHSKDYKLDIVRVGAALYGQQETVAGTRSAARWLTRIATLKKVSSSMPEMTQLHVFDVQGRGLRGP